MRGAARFLLVLALARQTAACTLLFPFSGDADSGTQEDSGHPEDAGDAKHPTDCGDAPEVAWQSDSEASSVALSSGFAFVGAWTRGVAVYSLDGPGDPSECDRWPTDGGSVRAVDVQAGGVEPDEVFALAVEGDRSTFTGRPVSMACSIEPESARIFAGAVARDLVLDEESGMLLVAADGGLDVYDVDRPDPRLLAGEPQQTGGHSAGGVAFTPDRVFVSLGYGQQIAVYAALGHRGLSIRDVVELDELHQTEMQGGRFANGVAVDGRFAFVCGGDPDEGEEGFLEAFYLDEGHAPEFLYSVDDGLASACRDIAVDDEWVYLADDSSLDVVPRGCAQR